MPEVHYDGKHLQTLRFLGNGSVCNVGGYISGTNRNLPSLNKKEEEKKKRCLVLIETSVLRQ